MSTANDVPAFIDEILDELDRDDLRDVRRYADRVAPYTAADTPGDPPTPRVIIGRTDWKPKRSLAC